jgi:hypothetical protein
MSYETEVEGHVFELEGATVPTGRPNPRFRLSLSNEQPGRASSHVRLTITQENGNEIELWLDAYQALEVSSKLAELAVGSGERMSAADTAEMLGARSR